jgi:cell division protease FtsH
MEYGMSRLGRVNYRQSNRSPFLMSEAIDYGRLHSEQTAREIDQEVQRLIQEALEQTIDILRERREALEAITKRLLEVEAIEGDELKRIIEEHLSRPLVVPGTNAATNRVKPSPPTTDLGSNLESQGL